MKSSLGPNSQDPIDELLDDLEELLELDELELELVDELELELSDELELEVIGSPPAYSFSNITDLP